MKYILTLLIGFTFAQVPSITHAFGQDTQPEIVVADTTTVGGREMVELTNLFGEITVDIQGLELRLEMVNFSFNRAYLMQQKELAEREEEEDKGKKKKK